MSRKHDDFWARFNRAQEMIKQSEASKGNRGFHIAKIVILCALSVGTIFVSEEGLDLGEDQNVVSALKQLLPVGLGLNVLYLFKANAAKKEIEKEQIAKLAEVVAGNTDTEKVKESVEDLKKDYDNRLLSKIGGSKILQEISKKVVELDTVYKTILASMSSRSITEYRKFCAEHYLSNLVELDVASEKMKALRTKYTEENKALRSKYNISEE